MYSLYLHIPFCIHRCAYCDFNTYAGLDDLIPEYVRALLGEIEHLDCPGGERLPVHTVFFGGGTPSLLPATAVEQILAGLQSKFDFQPETEITLEANPGTLSLDYLQALHAVGVNRISLGSQSANPGELRLLERQHSTYDVFQSVEWARQAGFDNLNLDLIFGLPYQSLESWQRTLETALRLKPEHLSLYALTLEHGTPMKSWVDRGLLPDQDPDLAADMYELASDRLEAGGFGQYEISNWARRQPDGSLRSCRHNLQYWRNQPYLGFGAGAHGYAAGFRTANVLAPAAYIKRCLDPGYHTAGFPRTPATVNLTPIDREAEIGETMMMGLRLVEEGVPAVSFAQRFDATLEDIFSSQITRLQRLGLLEWDDQALRLTKYGRLLGNQVFKEFI